MLKATSSRILFAAIAIAAVVVSAGRLPGADSGEIVIDGSNTVYPITMAMAEKFSATHPVKFNIAGNGSGAGLRALVAGQLAFADASRPIHAKELETAAGHGIEIVEIPIAYDGVTVVVNPKNDWSATLTIDELKRIWSGDSTIKTWADVRKGWPDAPIALFGRGKDSGTRELFTNAVVGSGKELRGDGVASEDTNVLVQGVVGNRYALGYMGFAYYQENAAMLRAVAVDAGGGARLPSRQAIVDGSYVPLSRALFLYLDKKAFVRPEIAAFIDFYLRKPEVIEEVGYVALEESLYEAVRKRVAARTTGSLFAEANKGSSLSSLLLGPPPVAAAEIKPVATAAKPPSPVALPVAKAIAPDPAATRMRPASDSGGRRALDRLRDGSLLLARLSLDDAATVEQLDRCLRELRGTLDELSSPGQDAARGATTLVEAAVLAQATIAAGEGYPALVDRLQLSEAGAAVISDAVLTAFKRDLLKVDNAALRLDLARTLASPAADNLARFTDAVGRLGDGQDWRGLDIVRCYARGGFMLR